MNLEFSLPLLWLLLFALLSLPTLPSRFRQLAQFFPRRQKSLLFLLFSFPIYLTLTILWSSNRLRAVLTAGIFWCLIISILTIPKLMSKKKIKTRIVKIFLVASVVISLFCWLQCILDIINISPDLTLLCPGCTYRSFGFPHPNGFAIEPQFMGNLLLAPCFLSLYLLFKAPRHKKILLPLTFFLVATLFLTFSRGAIYAFALGLFILILTRFIQAKKPQIFLSIPLVLLAFGFSLLAQGLMAQISPTNDTFTSGIDKVVNQLSLGHLHLVNNQTASDMPTQTSAEPTDAVQTSYFSGYVTESTEIRVKLTDYALDVWNNSPEIIFFGVGLGSAGTAIHDALPNLVGTPKEIIQNEYATILLELGVIGCLLIGISLIIIWQFFLKKLPLRERTYLLCLELAFAATLFFFSGFPNALHIYLFPVILYTLARKLPSAML